MFYSKDIELLQYSEGATDKYGIYTEGNETVKKTAKCDVQPYSKDLLLRDYGYNENVTKRVFLDLDSDFETGSMVEHDNQRYKVMRVIEWDDYMELMLNDE